MPFNRRSSVRMTSAETLRRLKPEPIPAVKKFIKIILPQTIERNMMQVPEAFVRFGPKLSDNVTIETPVGFKRSIQIKRIGDEVWFEKGWSEFAEAHSLNEGHVLFFCYTENSSFSVVIFDVSASEINYPVEKIYVTESDDDDNNKEVMDDDGDKKGFTGSVNLDDDDDTSEEMVDLDELLKKKVNIKSKEVIILDNDEVTD